MDVNDVKMCGNQHLHLDTDAPFEKRVVAMRNRICTFSYMRNVPVELVTCKSC